MISSEFASHVSEVSPHAVMPWPPRITPIGVRPLAPDGRDIEPELEPGPSPRHPGDAIAEAIAGQRLTVGGGRERDAGVGVEVVDVSGLRRGHASRCRSTAQRRRARTGSGRRPRPSRPHLDAGVDVDERAESVEPEDRQSGLGQGAEVAARPLDPQQLDGPAGHRVRSRCPSPTYCRPRSSCCAGPRRTGSTGRSVRRPPDKAAARGSEEVSPGGVGLVAVGAESRSSRWQRTPGKRPRKTIRHQGWHRFRLISTTFLTLRRRGI